ncbi:MAG: GDP-mannose 4,6-dehydratase, partial [Acidobacteriota bacterium]
ELIAHAYHHIHKLNISCLRFFTVYGPRQRPEMAIHKFTRLIDAGEPIPLFGDGSSERDYTYIDDCIEGVLAALDKAHGCRVFNLGESRTTSLVQLVELIAAALGKKPEIAWWPPQPGDVPRTYADISRSSRELGYRPRVTIEEGVKRFVSWYLDTNNRAAEER